MAGGGAIRQEVREGFLEAAGVAREIDLSPHFSSESLAGKQTLLPEPNQDRRSLETSR